MQKQHRAIAACVLVLLAGLPALGATAVGSAVSPQANTDYTIAELSDGGTQPSGKAPSTRWLSDYESVWVDYPHINPARRSDAKKWEAQQVLESGTKVRTDTLRFHASGPRSADTRTYTLKVVYWQVETRQVETDNGTRTEQVLTNVSTQTKQLKFSGSSDVAEVQLRSHYDKTVRVTAWIESKPETARWRFQHNTMRTQMPVETDTAGERLWWVISQYMLWVVFGGMVMFAVVFGMKRRAGRGPGKGVVWWAIAMVIVGGSAMLFLYGSIAEVLVDGPHILALVTLALLAIPLLEHDDSDRWLWIRPRLWDAVSASGGQAKDATQFEVDSRRVVRMPSGELAVVESGIRKFLARLAGGVAVLEGVEDMPTESRVIGNSRYNQIAWAKADAEAALEYEPEGWKFSIPTGGSDLIKLGIAAIALGALGDAWLGTTALGILALPAVALRPHGGKATFEPANAHQRASYVSMLYGVIEHEEAQTLEDSRQKRLTEAAKNQSDVEAALEQKDATLLEEAVSDLDADLGEMSESALDELDGEEDSEKNNENWLADMARGFADGD